MEWIANQVLFVNFVVSHRSTAQKKVVYYELGLASVGFTPRGSIVALLSKGLSQDEGFGS